MNRVTTGYSTRIVRVWAKVGSAQHAVYNHMACMALLDTVASVSVPTHLTHHHLCAKRRDPEMRAGDLFNERRFRLPAKPSVFSPDTSSVLPQQSKHATNAERQLTVDEVAAQHRTGTGNAEMRARNQDRARVAHISDIISRVSWAHVVTLTGGSRQKIVSTFRNLDA